MGALHSVSSCSSTMPWCGAECVHASVLMAYWSLEIPLEETQR
jgi:hypothetical protein